MRAAPRRFLRHLVEDAADIRIAVDQHVRSFTASHVPEGADGQVHRVAQRFALVAAGGAIAASTGIVPWSAGEATHAAGRCFTDWLGQRGGTGPAEIRDGMAQVRAFLLSQGQARLAPVWGEGESVRLPIRELAGFRKPSGDGWDFYITTAAWRSELCAGFDARLIASALADRELLLVPDSGAHRAKSVSVPGHGRIRLYHLPAAILTEEGDG